MKLYKKDVTPTYPKLSDAKHIFLNESSFGIFHWRRENAFQKNQNEQRDYR